MIPRDCFDRIYGSLRVLSWRIARRLGIDPEDLLQESYLNLNEISIDSSKSRGRSLEATYRSMLASVVFLSGIKLLRMENKHRHSNIELDLFGLLETNIVAEIEDGIFESTEVAIQKRRKIWSEQASHYREEAITAWKVGRFDAAYRHAQRAAMNCIIANMTPKRSAIPLLTYMFDYTAERLASERGKTPNQVAQINTRFKRLVKKQAQAEFDLIKARSCESDN